MAGKHRAAGQVTETSDYVAFLQRIVIGYGDRIADDPAALAHLRDLEALLTDQVNRGIWEANARDGGYSQNEIAAILGVSRQAVAKRIGLGEAAAAAVTEARGGGALVRIGDVRARRAELLERAAVPDRTGSQRERALRAV